MVNIINMTPHIVTFLGDAGEVVREVPPSGSVPRVSFESRSLPPVGGIPATAQGAGQVDGLPGAVDGVALIVSAIVRSAVPDRADVYSPGDLVRWTSEDAPSPSLIGQPRGCRGLVGNAPRD